MTAFIYTRVSTEMQIEGFSLEAQRNTMLSEAKHRNIEVVGEYKDEGKSGKNIKGRLGFQKMLNDVANSKKEDRPDYVMVYKLSRFGRNAADTMNSYQYLKDFDVNLLSVKDNIDTAGPMGSLLIAVMGSFAEMERENIIVQTMAGRLQRAKEGYWNGGFAPYGYKLVEDPHNKKFKKLVIDEETAEHVRTIFDKFIHTQYGMGSVAQWMNNNYRKPASYMESTGKIPTIEMFSTSFIKGILDNPVYKGEIAYGRRKTEKVDGTRNEFRKVKQLPGAWETYQGNHEAIISPEEWELAHKKRIKLAVKHEKHNGNKYNHILSGIIKCPVCGAPMYGIAYESKKRKDGTKYPPSFYYKCHNRIKTNGHTCEFKKNINQSQINSEVDALIKYAFSQTDFSEAILNRVGNNTDASIIFEKLEVLVKEQEKAEKKKDRLLQRMMDLDPDDSAYDSMQADFEKMLSELHKSIHELDDEITVWTVKLDMAQSNTVDVQAIYKVMSAAVETFDEMPDSYKQLLMKRLVEKIDIFPDITKDGRWVKNISFRIPIIVGDEEYNIIEMPEECGDLEDENSLSNLKHVETVVLLSQQKPCNRIEVDLDLDKLDATSAETKSTYAEIKEYVLKENGLKVSNLDISPIKRKCGLEVGENYNPAKSEDEKQPNCPEEKEKAIVDALKYFGMIG